MEISLCFWIGRINIAKMSILPQAIFRLNETTMKMPTLFFHRTRENNNELHMEKFKRPEQPKQACTLRELPEASSSMTSSSIVVTVIKTAWYQHNNRQVGQWNQTKELDINPHTYEHLIFDKEAKIITLEKKESIIKNGAAITGCQYVEECKQIHPHPHV